MRACFPLLLLSLAACASSDDTGQVDLRDPRTVTSDTAGVARLVAGNNAFAWDLFRQVGGDDNLVLAPFTASVALGMSLAGAAGTTAEEMRQVLHADLNDAAWHEAHGALLQDLSGDHHRAYTLQAANRAWGQSGYPWKEAFTSVLADDYGAPLKEIDFQADPAAATAEINAWVSEQTEGRIPQIVPPGTLNQDTRLALASALYLYAAWVLPFADENTADRDFTLADGTQIQVPTMSRFDETWWYAGDFDATVVRLPYVEEELAFYVVLPPDPAGLPDVEATIDADRVEDWVLRIQDEERHADGLVLPRFSFRSAMDLPDVLSALGMPSAFDPALADFSGMADTEPTLHISHVLHEGWISVDEAGTEAGGATVEISENGDPVVLYCDHPFLFFLRDELSGAILFLGRVANPSASKS
ncbi:MAG: serpin family protein [Deltaproteobacteria bacterium]|nr:serpin family protein [Deltaproteobacteria bacterium]